MPQTQKAGDNEAECPVYRDKKETGEQNHEKNKNRRDRSLPPRRPSHLASFGAHLLKKLQRVGHGLGESSR